MNETGLALPLGLYQGFSRFVLFFGSSEGWGVGETSTPFQGVLSVPEVCVC